jgi:vacuolar-type H+-ATPase subunit I/STV1
MLAELLSDVWLKLVVAALTAFGALVTFYNTWRKERQRDSAEVTAARDTIPAVMRNLATASIPMPALQVDQVNEMFKHAEKLCLAMERLAEACRAHIEETKRATDETRRAAAAAEKQADEARRLQSVIDQASRDADARAAAQRNSERSK